jgi:arylsulfatase A-like enzyme
VISLSVFQVKNQAMRIFILAFLLFSTGLCAQKAPSRPNVIIILADDHRYDAMGFTGAFPGLKTPSLDRMAQKGCHVEKACVATALCSPSRASILTGQYPHKHTVVDNQAPVPAGLTFFPQLLQKRGYQTGFFGKWHMGNEDDKPQPGFNQWLSFKGQGVYYNPTFNINGQQVPHGDSAYVSDLLTNYALDWMGKQAGKKPFFCYLSHKGVHAMFEPAKRHRGMYRDLPFKVPASMFSTATEKSKYLELKPQGPGPEEKNAKENRQDMTDWTRAQRYSWHGVDHMYHDQINFYEFYRRYFETLMAVDESVGRVLDFLENKGLAENTVVIYLGDNGFSFGEHGLIDKRHAYEESMRIPMLIYAPKMLAGGNKISQVIQNVDIAPTILEMAGVKTPTYMQGKSFLPLLQGKSIPWRDRAFYEYFWEYDFPQTPTMFALRTERYKFIYNHGVWDINELYDLQNDPFEINNLIRSSAHQDVAQQMRAEIFQWLQQTGGMQIPLRPMAPGHKKGDHRHKDTF